MPENSYMLKNEITISNALYLEVILIKKKNTPRIFAGNIYIYRI